MQTLIKINTPRAYHWKILSEEFSSQINSLGIRRKYRKKELIFRDTETYRGFFTVKSGIYKVFLLNDEGKEAVLRICYPGDVIVAHPIFHSEENCMYPAFCEALHDGELLFFSKEEFTSFLLENPRALFLFSALTVEHLNYFRKKMIENLLLTVKDRIFGFLCELGAKENYIALPISKQQLSSLLGTTPESVSRAFRSLLEESIIEESGDSFRVKKDRI